MAAMAWLVAVLKLKHESLVLRLSVATSSLLLLPTGERGLYAFGWGALLNALVGSVEDDNARVSLLSANRTSSLLIIDATRPIAGFCNTACSTASTVVW